MENIKVRQTIKCPLWFHQEIEFERCNENCNYFVKGRIIDESTIITCGFPIFQKSNKEKGIKKGCDNRGD